jgi:hypothetical protein
MALEDVALTSIDAALTPPARYHNNNNDLNAFQLMMS